MADERNWFALHLPVNPILDPLRSDPRFEKIVASLPPKVARSRQSRNICNDN
jgi:hypothetical protein